jgi:TonB-dependent receptor
MSLSINVTVISLLFLLSIKINAGTISGYVKNNKDNSSVPGAIVTLKDTKLGASADSQGYYFIDNVPAGSYKIKVHAIGFKSEEKSIIIDNNSGFVKLDFILSEEAVKMQEVVIRARANRELETSSRQTEKEAGNIVNVISAQTIDQSTDRTAADVLQRVSGMTLIRDNSGEGQYVVMRGLEQRYNNTLIDGIKIPSPESKDRFVPLDLFPSGLFERIEVTKSLTPETAGDAIGGSTNIMFREAPEKFTFSFRASTGTSSSLLNNSFTSFDKNSVNDLDPERMHGTVSDSDPTVQIKQRYNPVSSDFTINNLKFTNKPAYPDGLFSGLIGTRFFNNTLGLMASGTYENTFDRIQTDSYSISSDINNVDATGHLVPYTSTYNNQTYFENKIRSGAVVKADFIASDDHEISATYIFVHKEEDQVRNALQINVDGSRGSADLTYSYRSALRTQNISSISINGNDFSKSPVELRWTLNYTDAVQDRPDEAQYSILQNYDSHGKLQPFSGLGSITHSWRKNDDNQYLGKIDAVFHITDDGTQNLQAGLVTQKLNRANYEDDYQLNPKIINGSTQPFTSLDSAKTTVFGSGTTSGPSVYGYQNYKANEFMISSYFQYTMVIGQLQILGGLRWEQAKDKYYTAASPLISEYQSYVTMVNFIPGIHFRYEFTPEQIGRFSVTRSMSRPSYFDLVPAVDRSDANSSTGNPNLKPALATNVDLRYEYYPNPTDVYSLGGYFKKIENPIEDQYVQAGTVLSTSKGNGDPATIYGIEAVISKHFGGLGITANYSYVYSIVNTKKQVTTEDMAGDLVQSFYTETRPLESQSPQVLNLIITYENKEWETVGNLSYNYTGRRLVAVAYLDGYDTYEEGSGAFDFSADQHISSGFTFSLKLINLFSSPVVTDVVSGNYLMHAPLTIQRNFNKLRGTIGISYKF